MRGSKDSVGVPDVRSRRSFFRIEIVRQDQPLEMKLEFTPDFYHSELRAVCGPFFSTTFGHMFSLPFLRSSSVAAFRGPNSDNRNEACLAVSRQAHEIITPEASYSHTAFLNIRQDSSSKGERCMKDTDHPVGHLSVHLTIFGRVRSRRSCAWHNDQFGRGQNTGLGWSDPTFVHVSVPKVIRGVAPAQLRGDRAEYFVRAAFHSREPQ
jgi:hypothetical protein